MNNWREVLGITFVDTRGNLIDYSKELYEILSYEPDYTSKDYLWFENRVMEFVKSKNIPIEDKVKAIDKGIEIMEEDFNNELEFDYEKSLPDEEKIKWWLSFE